jgi:Ser/Thr protein kinase RdoA (MazF antagonist)
MSKPEEQELAEAKLLLHKYDMPYGRLTRLGGNVNVLWHVGDTPYLLRVSKVNDDAQNLSNGLQVATLLSQRGVPFAAPAYPLVWQVDTEDGPVRATLWFYEEVMSKPPSYFEFGELVRRFQEDGTRALEVSGLLLPDVLSVEDLRYSIDQLREFELASASEYKLLASWLPRLGRTAAHYKDAPRVLTHDDLWPANLLNTHERGLLLCDPDNLSRGPAEYDLAFIARLFEEKAISRRQVGDFERGYGGKIPDINSAWRLALFHRFRSVTHMMERRAWDPQMAVRLKAELPLWERKKGPQP